MTPDIIASLRLQQQQILHPHFERPEEVVRWMGVLQAQDYAMAKWAIGVRLPRSTDAEIENAMDRGKIFRTHVLRPTWHFVAAEDILWMLKLTAPGIKSSMNFMNRQLELDEAVFKKTNKIIEKALVDTELTRSEIVDGLQKKGIAMNSLRAAHIMLRAELDAIVCNGAMRNKQFTYALLRKKLKEEKIFTKEEASAELAFRYFNSHGPATLQDFSWWSGLSLSVARAGLEAVKAKLNTEKVDGQDYWFSASAVIKEPATSIHFLPAYDEFMVSYKGRSASLENKYASDTISGNGIFKPIIVVNGKVIGTWKRTFKKDKLVIETAFFRQRGNPKKTVLQEAVNPFGNFLSLKAELMK